ncbi:hypothetical protein CRG98_026991 [Punica granatum]|uniref:Uncharacterized protein n=1 Tax=Punica granatum TaxID=22663 RepID=A0A2I0J8S1_PUNGR|nr:hypothetical protein CRG98_026991 [Punica granatum]
MDTSSKYMIIVGETRRATMIHGLQWIVVMELRSYYGILKEIIELDYVKLPSKMVVLSQGQWFNPTSSHKDDDTSIVEVIRGTRMGDDDPYVITKQKKGITKVPSGSRWKETSMQVLERDLLFYRSDMSVIQRELLSQPERYRHVDTPPDSPIQHTEADPWLPILRTRNTMTPDSITRPGGLHSTI